MKLSYRNENDRCYGAAGMAIGLVVFDGEDMLAGISLDAPAHAMMEKVAHGRGRLSRSRDTREMVPRI